MNVEEIENYRHSRIMEVRFIDLDALAHVNNAKYLNYLEEARLAYARDVLGWDGDIRHLGLVVAGVEIQYKLPILLNEKVEIRTRVSRLGGRSFEMEYLILKINGENSELAARAKTVQVSVNEETGKSTRLPEEWRQIIQTYEPGEIQGA
ncbi:acyl-CoA thioesterase [Salinispira pacifica]|uniref:Thioesterase superfamily n=1 Tax=Salinispira pacifica TaxID=1307761 RepID=V5WHW9_9SPIO|nr:Thioesterase superfamily [Salinispira pacifica]